MLMSRTWVGLAGAGGEALARLPRGRRKMRTIARTLTRCGITCLVDTLGARISGFCNGNMGGTADLACGCLSNWIAVALTISDVRCSVFPPSAGDR